MKTILYLFDDINYCSGAQKVTFFQMKCLTPYYQICAFSLSRPQREIDLKGIPIIGEEIWEKGELFSRRVLEIFFSKEVSIWKKINRIWYAVLRRVEKGETYLERVLFSKIRDVLEEYDVVVVVSEASKLREVVSHLKHPKKIQWIHTDYALWSEFSDWTRMITKKDAVIYSEFDWIVTLSETSKKGFLKKNPQLKEKTVVIPNLIDGETIVREAKEEFCLDWEEKAVHLLTVGRLEKEKAYDRILDLCGRLKREGYFFYWYFIGSGSQKKHLEKRIAAENLEKQVKLLGKLENPYPLMKRCDGLVLLSEYEGTPVTIDEAMVLGIPVIAREVGGIAEQMKTYENGVLLQSENFYEKLKEVVKKKETERPILYKKRNQNIIDQIRTILEKLFTDKNF